MNESEILATLDMASRDMASPNQILAVRKAVVDLLALNDELRIKAQHWDDLIAAKETAKLDPDTIEWKELARMGGIRRMDAIKACRAAHSFSLRESVDCVDAYVESLKTK